MSWYGQKAAIRADLDLAEEATAEAAELRRSLRRKTAKGGMVREQKIGRQLERLADAMRPIRSYAGRLAYHPDFPYAGRVREVSRGAQLEAAALRRMRK